MNNLPIVCDGKTYPVVDLIAVPSLPRIFPTYTDKRKECSQWLREAFTHRFPRARVMPFTYDFQDVQKELITWESIMGKANHLLNALVERRRKQQYQQLPLIFLCHSFGGLVLKSALKIAERDPEWMQLFDLTRGIIFMACPHDERRENFQDCCLRCAAVELGVTNSKQSVLKGLKGTEGWSRVREIEYWFRETAQRQSFAIITFYETMSTTYRIHTMKQNDQDVLCPERLASLDFDHVETEGIDMDHTQLSSFPEPTDHFYTRLLDAIQKVMDNGQVHGVAAPSVQVAPSHRIIEQPQSESESIDMLPEFSIPRRSITMTSNVEVTHGNTPCFMLKEPAENPDFVGRARVLKDIQRTLLPSKRQSQSQAIFALCGLGGIGKTQIAMRFVNDAKANQDFRAILWVRSDTRSKLAHDFQKFAIKLALVEANSSDQNEAREVLKNWFRTTSERWLIVFDNMDGKDKDALLKDFRPKGPSGAVLITSRDPRLAISLGGQEIHQMDVTSATDMLWGLTKSSTQQQGSVPSPEDTESQEQMRTEHDSNSHWELRSTDQNLKHLVPDNERIAAERIVKKLGCYPLAIKTAAHMIIDKTSSMSEYDKIFSTREMIRQYEGITITDRSGEDYAHSLTNVFDMNFELFGRDERDLLYLLAFLDPDEILTTTLTNGASKLQGSDLDFVKNGKRFLKCRNPLISSSFVSWNSNKSSMSMHRIVREICHVRMSKEERQQAFTRAERILQSAYPVPERHFRHRPDLWPEQQRLLAHVQALGSFYKESHSAESKEAPLQAGLEFADVCSQAARFLYERGTFEQSYAVLKIAEAACEPLKDAEAIKADINGGFGSLATETNKFQEAYDQFKFEHDNIITAIDRGFLTRPNVREAIAQGGIANGLNGLKQYAEAEKEYWKCIDIWRSCPGQATIYEINLSTCLWLQDKLEEAEQLLKKIIIDPEDTTTYRTGHAMYTYGNVQISQAYELLASGEDEKGQAKFDEAFATHKTTLEHFRKVLKEHHHKTADGYYKVGWHLHRLQQYQDAIIHLNSALAIYSGSSFYRNETARTKYKLGCILRDAGQEIEGRKTLLQAEELRKEILGSNCRPARTEEDYNDLLMFWSR